MKKIKKLFISPSIILSLFLFFLSFFLFFSFFNHRPASLSGLRNRREDVAGNEEEFNKKLEIIAWEHWLDMFIHEAGHMLLVNNFHQQNKPGDFKIFTPKGFKAGLHVTKTLHSQKGNRKTYKLDFKHDGAAYYLITSQKSTTAEKFIQGFHQQYLIHLAGNTILKFFLENKPQIIAHLTLKDVVIGDNDIGKANNVDKTVKAHLTPPVLKQFKWEEKIAPNNVKQATIKILLAKKNWKIFQTLVKALIIKKILLTKDQVIVWNFTAQEQKILFEKGELPNNLKSKIPQKGEADYQIWEKFDQWVKLIANKHLNLPDSSKQPLLPKKIKKLKPLLIVPTEQKAKPRFFKNCANFSGLRLGTTPYNRYRYRTVDRGLFLDDY